MRVKLSTDAKQDVRQQIDYLRGKTIAGIMTFRNMLARAQRLLSSQPHAGHVDAAIPICGARRITIDGWHFDYDIIDETVWIQRITSSINTPTLRYDDSFDYESDGEHGEIHE